MTVNLIALLRKARKPAPEPETVYRWVAWHQHSFESYSAESVDEAWMIAEQHEFKPREVLLREGWSVSLVQKVVLR